MQYKQFHHKKQKISVIGQGTMGFGGYFTIDNSNDKQYIRAIKMSLKLGMSFIDTAEVYGNGHCEELVGQAIEGNRSKAFIATKFSPEHASYKDVLRAAEGSLKRLRINYIDLYQIHWPTLKIPIEETLEAMELLVKQRKIRYIGVSNFSLDQIKKVQKILKKNKIFAVQNEYNLFDRSIERDILPYCEKQNILTIAYSPLDQGKISTKNSASLKILEQMAQKYQKTVPQIILQWLVSHKTVIVIPKAAQIRHIKENAQSADFKLKKQDFIAIAQNCYVKPILAPVKKIKISIRGQGNRKVYQTIEQALNNKLHFVPSPKDLADDIRNHHRTNIKPVRLKRITHIEYDYELLEGRVRYWAWFIAYNAKKPIPALIRI